MFFNKQFDFVVPLTSSGQSHLGPPGAPRWPEVAILDDIWGHFGVMLELIWGTVGVFLMPAGFRSRTWRVRAGTQNQKRLCHRFWDLHQVLRRVLAVAGARFSLGGPVAKNVDCWLHLGEIFGVQLYSLRGLPESIFGGKMGCLFPQTSLAIWGSYCSSSNLT